MSSPLHGKNTVISPFEGGQGDDAIYRIQPQYAVLNILLIFQPLNAFLRNKNQKHALQLIQRAAHGLKQNNKVWQNGFHPIGLQNEFLFHQKLNYIHENPVRKRYVRKAEYWVYSSARNYAGYADVAMPIDELV